MCYLFFILKSFLFDGISISRENEKAIRERLENYEKFLRKE